ncbi:MULTISPECIES: NAD(P)H-dependent oxidoreductase [Acinetobacter]|uniref:NAD(P)H-dependent oxidoreductase n=1 Tax=Acinetobacter piscicola TaxID=2006115 RepID=A0A7S6VZQ4_9GAMM|nr:MULTISPECIES: NAD(P)H-dependent oxidoreductase [Acinetobacter]MDM1759043.1 NAD(P)H-dependent oxidoreductase [Acinetobacter sp. 256-1]MDM1762258.1 NAD(P)H-dependent oxidoreductase [Acinetobacter sp. 251-1]QOW47747.1 NAD(P)H-dependent oxidoreductase [Acinetobacter piscicola]
MNIFIIVGSIRQGRTAIKVAEWLSKEINQLDFHTLNTRIVDLKEWNLPLFAGAHPPASGIYDQPRQQEWADHIAQADAFIFISPEYNHGYSAVLKNAIDYLGKEWKSKPFGIVSYGGNNGTSSVEQLKQVCTALDMIDSNAVIQLRDIFNRNKTEHFEGNEFDNKAVASVINKLIQYSNI